MRLSDDRPAKRAVHGWIPLLETVDRQRKRCINTPQYWRRLILEAGIDATDLDRLTEKGTEWTKTQETNIISGTVGKSKDNREHAIETNRNETKQLKSLTCRYCQKQCLNAGGLGIHIKRMHEGNCNPNTFKYTKCNSSFKTESAMKNHQKSCEGGETDGMTKRCLNCNKEISSYNFARYSITCRTSKNIPQNTPLQPTARMYR